MKPATFCVVVAMLAACWLAMPSTVEATVTETKKSADFDWKYEMDVKPTAEDLDGNTVVDFTEDYRDNGTASVLDGILTITSSRTDRLYYTSGAENELWPLQGFSYAEGYTFEIRLKVISDSGDLGAIMVYPTPSDSDECSCLNIKDTGQWWGTSGGVAFGDQLDNTDAFHVFRVAQEPALMPGAEVYSVWRDGVLLADDLSSRLTLAGCDFMRFGDAGTNSGGVVEVDYLRFISGAWAPDYTPPPDPIPGDANEDDVVNDADASILAAHWQQSGEGIGWGDGDFNDDGVVNDQDASILAAHWGESREGSTAPVPEPGAMVLLLGGLLSLLVGWRRK
jgi:hypothetical protein